MSFEVEEMVCDKCLTVACLAGDVMCYESKTAGTVKRYRPMTSVEVEDMVRRCQLYIKEITLETLIERMQRGDVFDYKGAPVRLKEG